MLLEAYNIKWDTDGEDIDLPTTVTVNIPNQEFIGMTEDEVSDHVSDMITNDIGFCHMGFSLRRTK